MTNTPVAQATIVSQSDSSMVIALSGELDIASTPAITASLSHCIPKDCIELTLDLRQLTFIDSSGVAAIVPFIKQLDAQQGRCVVRNTTRAVRKVLELTGVARLVDVIDAPTKSPLRGSTGEITKGSDNNC